MAVAIVGVALFVPATALASKTFFTATDGKASLFLTLKDQGGKQKRVDVSWDGLKCEGDRFTGGLDDAIKVKSDGSFKSQQPIIGLAEGVDIDAKMKGQVNERKAKITGTLKFLGDCRTKASVTATASAGERTRRAERLVAQLPLARGAAAAAHVRERPADQGAEPARDQQGDDQRRRRVDEQEVDVDLLEVLRDQDQQQHTCDAKQPEAPAAPFLLRHALPGLVRHAATI